MSDPTNLGFPLYEGLVGDGLRGDHRDLDIKIALLTKFKGHVKKELLYVPAIKSYFESLFFVLGSWSGDDQLLVLAHSSLCYLVKRVAMQVPSHFKDLKFVKELLACLFQLEDANSDVLQKRNIWTSSCRALEAVYLVQPSLLQKCLKELLEDLAHKRKILLVIDEFLQMTKRNSSSINSDSLLMDIFNVDCLQRLAANEKDGQNNRLVLEILRKNFHDDDELKNYAQHINEDSTSFKVPIFDVDYELSNILKEYGTHESSLGRSDEYRGRDFESMDDISDFLSNLLIPFQSIKETEQNWKLRQSNLCQLRDVIKKDRIIRENALSFLSICKDLQVIECIGKAVLSLRTTLSMTACQVIRTFLQSFNQILDIALLDQIFAVLKALLLTAKKISSNTALSCLIVMFTYAGFHNKLFQNCFMLMNEKSVSARSCSAILLRIVLIKFTDNRKLDNSTIYIEEWLKKGITDAQTSVRELTRVTFWYYYKSYPSNARNFLNTQFSSQLKKAIELSIPNHLDVRYNLTHSMAPSSSSSDPIGKFGSQSKRFPSYAKPTQSSNAFLQRLSKHRSTSEYVPSEMDQNAQPKRKISAPPPSLSLRRPANTTQERKASNLDNEAENSIQIDLTEDISNGHSNSLISKYLGKESLNSEDLERMYQNLNSSNQPAVIEALQLLQKKLLTDGANNQKQLVDFNRIIPALRMLMVKTPAELKPFLTISTFCRSIPLTNVIEIHAINFMDFSDQLLNQHSQDEIMQASSSLIMWLHSNAYERDETNRVPEVSLHYMKYKKFIYNLCFRILCDVLRSQTPAEQVTFMNDQYMTCILALSAIWGQEFDERLYFETLNLFYTCNKELFKQAMNKVESVSTVLQICNKLAASDQEGNFDYEAVMEGRRSMDIAADTGEEVVEDRRFMEMTMVNPFRQNRSTSDGSVVHHGSNLLGAEAHEETREGKISEMTKVVSVYELPVSQDIEAEVDQDGDLEMCEPGGPSLSDIFTPSTDGDHCTVKFSNEPPKIINPSTSSSSAEASGLTKDTTAESHEMHDDTSKERDKSPVTPLSDHEAKFLSQGINGIDITPKNHQTGGDVSSLKESSEILNRAVHENVKERSSLRENGFLNHISPESLTYYEFCQLYSITEDAVKAGDHFKQMMQAIARIKNGSFTIRHLTNITAPLLTFSVDEKVKEWLETEGGYEEMLQLSIFLLSSEVETFSIPMNMACKCILLIECLVLLNSHLDNVVPITSVAFRDIWNLLVEMLGKLNDYSNEIYVLLHDLRDLLNETEFFSATDITTIISFLATQAQENGPTIKETFLIETLSCVIDKHGSVVKKHQFPEVIQMMQYFLESDHTEWRCASASVLAQALRYLTLTEKSEENLAELFSSITERQYHLIKLIAFE